MLKRVIVGLAAVITAPTWAVASAAAATPAEVTHERTVTPLGNSLVDAEYEWQCGADRDWVFAAAGGYEVTNLTTVQRGDVVRTNRVTRYRGVRAHLEDGTTVSVRAVTTATQSLRRYPDGGHEMLAYHLVSRWFFSVDQRPIGTWGFSYDNKGHWVENHGSCIWSGQ